MRKGWTIEYQYDEKTLEDIEAPIQDYETGETFYPFILKRDEQYTEEGEFMHHCVATYADKDESMIVSLRTKDNKDRVTCEYRIQDGSGIQQRSFCNAMPPDRFLNSLHELSQKLRQRARFGTLNWKEKKKVNLKIKI